MRRAPGGLLQGATRLAHATGRGSWRRQRGRAPLVCARTRDPILATPAHVRRVAHPVHYAVGKQVIADVGAMTRGDPVHVAARSFHLGCSKRPIGVRLTRRVSPGHHPWESSSVVACAWSWSGAGEARWRTTWSSRRAMKRRGGAVSSRCRRGWRERWVNSALTAVFGLASFRGSVGQVAEWLKAPVSKTGIPFTRYREFESLPVRSN
jgi:hypothetical protein